MAAPPWDIHTASEELLIDLCDKAEKENGRLNKYHHGDQVIKLSDTIAFKYECIVSEAEARTQEFAHRNADPTIVHIPRIYRFFVYKDPSWDAPRGYLFMEYISGQLLQNVDLNAKTDIIPRITKIIEHLGQIQDSHAVPGPIGGGEPQGYLYGDDGAKRAFSSTADFQAWLNIRLALRDKSINIGSLPLVLCHTDLCRRNMILEENDRICLLDWGYAGMYPRYFEIASLSYAEEKESMALLQIVRAANLRYSFDPPEKNPGTPERLRILRSLSIPPFVPSQASEPP
ncbi:hypothetical protein N431DRAFT_501459 [Stipitochalara longipes BDJ]|nr:hypothetical protein N431DRAFT_501459 [Stipitochalara longipes BDJ]